MGADGRGFVRHHATALSLGVRLIDLVIVVASGPMAQALLGLSPSSATDTRLLTVVVGLTAAMAFEYHRLYRPWRGSRLLNESATIVAASFTTFGISALVIALADRTPHEQTITLIACWLLIATLGVVVAHLALRCMLRAFRTVGYNQRRVLLLGISPKALAAARKLIDSPWTGYQVLGYVDDRVTVRSGSTKLQRLGTVADAEGIVERLGINEVWIGYPMSGERRAAHAIHVLRNSMASVRFLLDVDAFNVSSCTMTEVAGIPVLNIHPSPLDFRNGRLVKSTFDRVMALVLLVLASPLMLGIAAGVRLSSPGPILYRQQRVGWKKQRFTMLKFRTMPVTVEAASGPVWARRDDGRATRFGNFLRRTSLDELPQLFNVLRGEMSIVGPRPERPEFVERFKEEIPWYMKKHMVKGGITGWAQVNGWRGDTDLEQRIEHDLFYIQHWSLWFDLRIIGQTFISGFIHKNAY